MPAGDCPARLAYADPPYPGQSKRHYGNHPDYAGEVDHAALVAQLAGYDGWALSTSAAALREVLALCPPDVRVAVWDRPNSDPPGNRGTWHWGWEPVIVRAARPPEITTRDILRAASRNGFLGGEITGEKPAAFCSWMFALLGARPGDSLDDLFRGACAVGRAWESWSSQLAFASEPAEQLALA